MNIGEKRTFVSLDAQRKAQPTLLAIGLKRQVRLFIEVAFTSKSSLLRPDPDQYLAGRFETVRSLELAQLLFNFDPGSLTLSLV